MVYKYESAFTTPLFCVIKPLFCVFPPLWKTVKDVNTQNKGGKTLFSWHLKLNSNIKII